MNVENFKLSNKQIQENIHVDTKELKKKIKSLHSFKNDLQPQESKEFREILGSIWLTFFGTDISVTKPDDLRKLKSSIVNVFISVNAFDIFQPIFNQLFHDVFGKNYTDEINDNLYNSIQIFMDIFLNYTDESADFGIAFCKHDKILNLYHKMIKEFKENFLNKSISKSIRSILKDSLITLYNTLIHDASENLIKMKAMNYLDTIKDFLKCEDKKVKTFALLITAYVADENESKLFKSDPNSISYLIDLLNESINNPRQRSHGFSTEELSKGLEKLSKNDENKQLLVELGILPVIKILLKQDDVKYKKSALSILWSLSFDRQNRVTINKEFWSIISEMKSEWELSRGSGNSSRRPSTFAKSSFSPKILTSNLNEIKLKDEGNKSEIVSRDTKEENTKTTGKENYIKVLHGLIWTLTEETKKLEEKKKGKKQESPKEKHIMISYNWSNAEIAMKICDALIDKGYKVWIDKYNITDHENLMESMAQAIQNSFVVLICVSLTYKDSDSCRAEALYAKNQKKPIIPVMVQKKYRPDGWLGICICDLHYCDFLGRYKFDEALELLIKKLNKIVIEKKTQKPDEIDHVDSKSKVSKKRNLDEWTNEKVKEWFQMIGIEKIVWKDHYTGSELDFLRTVSKVPGEAFYQICKTELQITDLRDLRILFRNLRLL